MALRGQKSIVLRGSINSDPEAEGYVDVEIGVYGLFPDKVNEAEEKMYGGGKVRRDLKQRYTFKVFCRPFKVRAQGDEAEYQDFGDLVTLKTVASMPHIWLWRAYGALSTGTLPRANVDGEETFWNPRDEETNPDGILPIKVVRPDIEPDPEHSEGVDNLTFTLKAEDRI